MTIQIPENDSAKRTDDRHRHGHDPVDEWDVWDDVVKAYEQPLEQSEAGEIE